MPHWSDIYPHKLYASALLLDGKIENWKVVDYPWIDIYGIKNYWKRDRMKDYTIVSQEWEVNNDKEHNDVFTMHAPKWFKQWELADDYRLASPYTGDSL